MDGRHCGGMMFGQRSRAGFAGRRSQFERRPWTGRSESSTQTREEASLVRASGARWWSASSPTMRTGTSLVPANWRATLPSIRVEKPLPRLPTARSALTNRAWVHQNILRCANVIGSGVSVLQRFCQRNLLFRSAGFAAASTAKEKVARDVVPRAPDFATALPGDQSA